MIVIDDFLANPLRVRKIALKSEFIDWQTSDGEIWKRVCLDDVPGLQEGIENAVGSVDMLGMGYRLNFGGELPNAAIHSDLGWGSHAAVLYLSHGAGGTAFWKHKETGATRIDIGDTDLVEKVSPDWDDVSKWEMVELAEMKFNRCIIYESQTFHSRYPLAAFGNDEASGRLIAVAFFNLVAND